MNKKETYTDDLHFLIYNLWSMTLETILKESKESKGHE